MDTLCEGLKITTNRLLRLIFIYESNCRVYAIFKEKSERI